MVNWDFILIIAGAVLGGAIVGWGLALFSNALKKFMDKKRAAKIMSGKLPIKMVLDGEHITIKTFKWKNHKGEIQVFEIPQVISKKSRWK